MLDRYTQFCDYILSFDQFLVFSSLLHNVRDRDGAMQHKTQASTSAQLFLNALDSNAYRALRIKTGGLKFEVQHPAV